MCIRDSTFPNDPTEWIDTDADGYGDNIDAFPFENTQWTDTDGDGFGDNETGLEGDDCMEVSGTSHEDGIFGCIDSDGDGWADSIDDLPSNPEQHRDLDGYGERDDASKGDYERCIETSPDEISMVDVNGCGPSERDGDYDTFTDDMDQCPNTPFSQSATVNTTLYLDNGNTILNPFVGCAPSEIDADGDSVYYSIETPEQIGSIISPDNSELTLMPVENWFGLSEITVTLHDGSGLMDTETFSLMVNPINDAPSFHFTDSLTVNEGSDITFMSMADLYNSGLVVDVDDSLEALEFSLTLLDLPFTINWDGELESVPVLENIAPNFSGPGGLILNVSDGIYLVHDTIPVMVYNINTPTVVGVMDTIFVDEDDDVNIMSMEALYNNGLISDIDNNFNELSFSIEINSDEIQIEWDDKNDPAIESYYIFLSSTPFEDTLSLIHISEPTRPY